VKERAMAKKTAKKTATKKKKILQAGESITLVIPRAKSGCLVETPTMRVKAGQRLLMVIPTARKGCDI
jgi:hypothetical protein